VAGEHDGAYTGTELVDVDEELVQLAIHQQIDRVHGRALHSDGEDAVVGPFCRQSGESTAHPVPILIVG
jgi:hypothetical protein